MIYSIMFWLALVSLIASVLVLPLKDKLNPRKRTEYVYHLVLSSIVMGFVVSLPVEPRWAYVWYLSLVVYPVLHNFHRLTTADALTIVSSRGSAIVSVIYNALALIPLTVIYFN